MKYLRHVIWTMLLLVPVAVLFQNCSGGEGTTVDNPLRDGDRIELKFGTYETTSLDQVSLCLTDVYFRIVELDDWLTAQEINSLYGQWGEQSGFDEVFVEYDIDSDQHVIHGTYVGHEVELDADGTTVGSVFLPPGIYDQSAFRFNECLDSLTPDPNDVRPSLVVRNANGTYSDSSMSSFFLHYEGHMRVVKGDSKEFFVDLFTEGLEPVASNSELGDNLQPLREFDIFSLSITPVVDHSALKINGMIKQSDGKFVGVAKATVGNAGHYLVVRFNSDGSVDGSFGADPLNPGMVSIDAGPLSEGAWGVDIATDGSLFVVGRKRYAGGQGDNIAVLKLTSSGLIDTGFGDAGWIDYDSGGMQDHGNDIKILSDDSIIVVGQADTTSVKVLKYDSNGDLVAGFGVGGVVTVPYVGDSEFRRQSLIVQPDGKLLIAGHTTNANLDWYLLRLNTDGSPDLAFDGDGVLTYGSSFNDVAHDVAVQPDGKILVAGVYSAALNRPDFALVRFNANGSLDAGFGTGGLVYKSFRGSDEADQVRVLADGRIAVTGNAQNGLTSDYMAMILNSDGSPDTNFSADGVRRLSTVSDSKGGSLVVADDGRLVIGGSNDTDLHLLFVDIN